MEELADRPAGFVPKDSVPFRKLLPLAEVIAAATGAGQPGSKKVWDIYLRLLKRLGSEFNVLMSAGRDAISAEAGEKIADLVISLREGRAEVEPGYDGVYGRLSVSEVPKSVEDNSQKRLDGFMSGKAPS